MDQKGDGTRYRVPSPFIWIWNRLRSRTLKCRRSVRGSWPEHNEEKGHGCVESSEPYGGRPGAGKELTHRFLAVEDWMPSSMRYLATVRRATWIPWVESSWHRRWSLKGR